MFSNSHTLCLPDSFKVILFCVCYFKFLSYHFTTCKLTSKKFYRIGWRSKSIFIAILFYISGEKKPRNLKLVSVAFFQIQEICGLCYNHITIVNYYSSAVNKFGASHTDDARVVIYDCHMFIVQATGVHLIKLFLPNILALFISLIV